MAHLVGLQQPEQGFDVRIEVQVLVERVEVVALPRQDDEQLPPRDAQQFLDRCFDVEQVFDDVGAGYDVEFVIREGQRWEHALMEFKMRRFAGDGNHVNACEPAPWTLPAEPGEQIAVARADVEQAHAAGVPQLLGDEAHRSLVEIAYAPAGYRIAQRGIEIPVILRCHGVCPGLELHEGPDRKGAIGHHEEGPHEPTAVANGGRHQFIHDVAYFFGYFSLHWSASQARRCTYSPAAFAVHCPSNLPGARQRHAVGVKHAPVSCKLRGRLAYPPSRWLGSASTISPP